MSLRAAKWVPVLGWLPGYRGEWLSSDVLAGLTTAAVVIPKSMAYASIAGLPVEAGLYVALAPMLLYALLGTSRPLSVSSTSTIAILVATQLRLAAPSGDPSAMIAAAATLALLTGAFLVLAGVLRLGFLASFISDPVLSGFKAGIGLVIIVDQLPKLLGVHIDKVGFFRDIGSVVQHIPTASVPTVVLAAVMLAVLLVMEHFTPHAPAPLLAVTLGIAASGILGLSRAGVALVGNIPPGIPTPALPGLSLARVLWPGALGIALMSFIESIAAGRSFARHADPRPDPDQELRALGAANIASGLFCALPAGGGTSQTAVNSRAGARTQLAEIVTAVVVLAVLLFLAPLIGLMPQAVLAAVVVVTTLPLLKTKDFLDIAHIRRMELWWALAALAGVVLLGTLQGILVAVTISALALMRQANRPPVYALGRVPGTDRYRPLREDPARLESFPGLLMARTEGRMTFASAPRAGERLWSLVHEAHPRVLLLECSAIPDFEYTALRSLTDFEERLREGGVTLWLATLNPTAQTVIERSPLGPRMAEGRIFPNLNAALAAYLESPPWNASPSETAGGAARAKGEGNE